MGKFCSGKRKASGISCLEAVGLGKLQVGHLEWDSLWDWLGVHIWLFLVGPKLETGTEIREAVSYSSGLAIRGLLLQGYFLTSWVVTREVI